MMNPSTQRIQSAATAIHDPRWASVAARDPEADGTFFYSVATTGIYCRPSCAARLAKPEHVRFHATCRDAEQAGFRPCKRCRPNQVLPLAQQAAKIVEVCRFIESSDAAPCLDQLAQHAGLSASRFHRLFKTVTGLTPKQYAAAHRAKLVRNRLRRSRTVTEALYGAGFNSNGRFYDKSNHLLGMTPSRFRADGAGMNIRFAVGDCSLGAILVAASDRGICAILLGDDAEALVRDVQNRFSRAHFVGGDARFERLVATAVGLVDAPARRLDLPLDIRGTAFQQLVWQALLKIPAGSTATYTDIAKRIGAPKSVRAVAQACGANPIAVAIPCHRVVRIGGGLSGYRWGLARKRALLEREQQA